MGHLRGERRRESVDAAVRARALAGADVHGHQVAQLRMALSDVDTASPADDQDTQRRLAGAEVLAAAAPSEAGAAVAREYDGVDHIRRERREHCRIGGYGGGLWFAFPTAG